MSVIISTASSVGFIMFLIGYVGPLILWPEANLGPLLGIFITGPLGFFSGGVVGFWLLLRNPAKKVGTIEWGMLFLFWLLSMAWYLMFYMFGPTAILLGTICQLVAVVGTAVLYRQRCRDLNKPVDRRSLSIVFAALLIIGTEVFPPVTHPDWSRPQDGYLQNPPAAVFYWDARLDSSRKVPQLAINRSRLMEIWLWVASINLAAWLVLKPSNSKDEEND